MCLFFIQVTRGENGTLSFEKHEKSSCHRRTKVMITLPATTVNIGELLSKEHAVQKGKNRASNYIIRFLCRQGLALRGDNEDGNLTQLVLMKAEVH